MNLALGRRPVRTFAVSEEGDEWRIRRDAVVTDGRFHSRGDAVRAACFKARDEEKHGHRVRVVAQPGDLILPHHEPHFGL